MTPHDITNLARLCIVLGLTSWSFLCLGVGFVLGLKASTQRWFTDSA